MQPVIEAAPRLMDFLGPASIAHLDGVRSVLDAAGLAYRINPRLVRGMDYYNLTVFEWVTDKLGSQGTVCGGGRYDTLIEQLGGKPAPAVGFGMGIERLLLLLDAVGIAAPSAAPTLYAIVPSASALAAALVTCEVLRGQGLSVQMHAAGREAWGSMKSQFKRADASGARYALIFGDEEVQRAEVAVKDLRDPDAEQRSLPMADARRWGADLLDGAAASIRPA
jgi:histidyl-tRNA synthetase